VTINKAVNQMARGILHALFSANRSNVRDKDVVYVISLSTLIFLMLSACLGFVHSIFERSLTLACAALGLSIIQLVHFNISIALHVCIVSFVVLYQLIGTCAATVGAPLIVEGIVAGIVVFVVIFEDIVVFYLIRSKCEKISNPETMTDMITSPGFNQFAGKIAGFVLLSFSLIPYTNVNVFTLPLQHKCALLFTWASFALTEAYKKDYADEIRMTSTPCKCAPILYLPYYYWAVVLFFIIVNLYLVYKTQYSSAATAVKPALVFNY
jgi:hypothetical protein